MRPRRQTRGEIAEQLDDMLRRDESVHGRGEHHRTDEVSPDQSAHAAAVEARANRS